jgi:D-glycero-alpha-D-manno-heptose-7-phosphate kinase
MLIRAKAPLRISFARGGMDVPPFPQQEGGRVLSATIGRYAWGTLRPREDGKICINSLDFGTSLGTQRPSVGGARSGRWARELGALP